MFDPDNDENDIGKEREKEKCKYCGKEAVEGTDICQECADYIARK